MSQFRYLHKFQTRTFVKAKPSISRVQDIFGVAPDFNIVHERFLRDDLQKRVNIYEKLDYLNGQGLFFDKLSCVTAQNLGDDELISLDFREHENLVGIIGFANHPSVICLDDNGSLCVGLLPQPKHDIINNGVGRPICQNYKELLHYIDKKTKKWWMESALMVSKHVCHEKWTIEHDEQHAILVINTSDKYGSARFGVEYNRVEYNNKWKHEVLPIMSRKATEPEYKVSDEHSLCIKPRQSYLLPSDLHGFRNWTLTNSGVEYTVNVKNPEIMTQELIKFIKRKVLCDPINIIENKDDKYYSGIVETSAGTYCGELHEYDDWDGVDLSPNECQEHYENIQ